MKILLRSLKKEKNRVTFDIIVIHEGNGWDEEKGITTHSYATNKEGRGLFARDEQNRRVLSSKNFYLYGNIETIRKKIKKYIKDYIEYYQYI